MSGVPEDDYRLFNTEATVGFAKAAQRAASSASSFCPRSGRSPARPPRARSPRSTSRARPTPMAARSSPPSMDWRRLASTGWPRLALVYGPGVEGNVAKLIKLARSPYPLPLAGLKGEHSLLGLDNLVEAVDKVLAAEAPLSRPLIVRQRSRKAIRPPRSSTTRRSSSDPRNSKRTGVPSTTPGASTARPACARRSRAP